MRHLPLAVAPTALLAAVLALPAGIGAASPSFTLVVVAPQAVRSLLMEHLELGRYREVSDLDEAELARLLALTERDTRRLLGTLGLFNPRIDIAQDSAAQPPRITLTVDPGPATVVSQARIDFEGEIATTSQGDASGELASGEVDDPTAAAVASRRAAVRAGWGLGPGQRWTQADWDSAKASALRTLVARRYLRGRIAHSEAVIDALGGQAQLDLRLDSGPTFRLGPLQVIGVQRYDPRLVPRLTRLAPGDVYDEDRLTQAQMRLAGSGYFDSAFLYIDPESDPQAAPVEVRVREAPLQRLDLGLGLTTDRGPRAWLEHRHQRVPGIDWRAVTRLELERIAPRAQTEWTAIPDEDGWRWGVLASTERLRDGAQITQAQRLRVGRLLTDEPISRHGYLQLDRAHLSNAQGQAPATLGDGSALAAHYLWTGHTLDRLARPTRGHQLGLEVGLGVTLDGPRGLFQRTVLRGMQLIPMSQGRLQLRAEGGFVLSQATTRVPSTQLFRTGGDTSVRGYGYRDIGAERPGFPLSSGRYLAVGSIEWQRPLRWGGETSPWEQALFVDTGLVSDRDSARRASVGVGTGLRYASPVGPLRVDLAYGLRARRLRLHLSVGVTF